jgi:hypothetical protein
MGASITDKGKGPTVPEVQTTLEFTSAEPAAAAMPEQSASKTPDNEKPAAPVQSAAPAKPSAPDQTSALAKTSIPAKSDALKIKPSKPGTQSAPNAPSKVGSRPSSALALHFGKAASQPSFFTKPELEGRVPLLSKSEQSLGSLKEYCTRWNDANGLDTADSRSRKIAEVSATGNPDDIVTAKPIPIACDLLSLQQRLHLMADATNVSLFCIHIPSPRKCQLSGIRGNRDFPIPFVFSYFQISCPTYELDSSFKS